ncbi:acyltransferase family protein [Peribacillus sp. SCS-37]|uniref:acyltransferase family protein n=1 Tax=Paraperibacillus esterisolvens TaxID=3115296 RepID=UPI003905E933
MVRQSLKENLILNFRIMDKFLDGKVSIYLDLIRGLAAILVVMEHLSPLLFSYSNESSIIQVLFMVNLLGGASVRIFFVLSGLFISRSIIRSFLDGKWSWASYLINRFSRLYVVLLPALLLTFTLDGLSSNLFNSHLNPTNQSIFTFFGNLLFLQEIILPTFGSNHPLWSLSIEFWFYLIYPLLLLAAMRSTKLIVRVLSFILGLCIFGFLGLKISFYFIIWFLGSVILFMPAFSLRKKWSALIPSFFFFIISTFLRPLANTDKLGEGKIILHAVDISIAVSFVLFIYVLINTNSNKITSNKPMYYNIIDKISKTLAGFSFSLYLIHQPILMFLNGLGRYFGFVRMNPSVITFSIEIILVMLMCLLAYYFSLVTERKTTLLRNFLVYRINHQIKSKQAA